MANSRTTFFLPEHTQVTLTFDALSSGQYANIGNPGDAISEVTAISASQVKVIGPFIDPQNYEVVLDNGTFTSAFVEKFPFEELTITPEANVAEIDEVATGAELETAVNGILAILVAHGLMEAAE